MAQAPKIGGDRKSDLHREIGQSLSLFPQICEAPNQRPPSSSLRLVAQRRGAARFETFYSVRHESLPLAAATRPRSNTPYRDTHYSMDSLKSLVGSRPHLPRLISTDASMLRHGAIRHVVRLPGGTNILLVWDPPFRRPLTLRLYWAKQKPQGARLSIDVLLSESVITGCTTLFYQSPSSFIVPSCWVSLAS